MRINHHQFRKRLICVVLLLQIAFIFNSEKYSAVMDNPLIIDLDKPVLEIEESLVGGIFDSNECLLSKSDAKKILINDYGAETSIDPDEKQRFILGKCNPVILVNGIFASRLSVSVNCKKLKEKENDKFKEMRVFCGNQICYNENEENEEQVIFPALFGSAFSLVEDGTNKFSACTGYFLQYFNTRDECPKTDDGNNVCLYSDYIRIKYYGGTEKTKSEAKCGLKAIEGVIYTGMSLFDEAVNQGAAKVFKELDKKLSKMGFSEGFSLAGVPQDYRRFTTTNTFAEKALEYHVNRLYANTGKPVIIIGHSYGNLLSLSQLLKAKPQVLSKIKQFIAIAPPFAGASKLQDVFIYGHRDFNIDLKIQETSLFKVNFDTFGQRMLFKSVPVISELRPLPIVNELFTSSKYKELGEALKERINLERVCEEKNCDASYVKKNSVKWENIFGTTFPNLNEKVCKLTSSIFDIFKGEDTNLNINQCRAYMYNLGLCPASMYKTKSFAPTLDDFENYCEKYDNTNILFSQTCDKKGECLDSLYESPPYPFEDLEKTDYLIEQFNKNFGDKLGKIDRTFFESKDSFIKKSKKMIEYHRQTSNLKDLPIPPVDTILIYSNFIPTSTGFILDKTKSQEKLPDSQILDRGGDGTVPNWSSYLVGLKWLYDKKKDNKSQKITLVEYCSKLAKSDEYKYVEGTNKTFYALGCACLNDNNAYVSHKDCTHATMLSDNKLIDYIGTIVYTKNDKTGVTEGKKQAVKNYNKNKNYLNECNDGLFAFSDY